MQKKKYAGQTGRFVRTRFQEHLRDFRHKTGILVSPNTYWIMDMTPDP